MTMIDTPLVLLAKQCGATFYTPGPTRAIRGLSFTFAQLEALAAQLRAEAGQQRAGAPGAAAPTSGSWIAGDDVARLVRELDVALHGEADSAPQASLCDIVGLAKAAAGKLGRPVLAAPAAPAVDAISLAARDVLSPERMREEFTAWAEVAYRHEDDFSKRDFEICFKAWRFGGASALIAAQAKEGGA